MSRRRGRLGQRLGALRGAAVLLAGAGLLFTAAGAAQDKPGAAQKKGPAPGKGPSAQGPKPAACPARCVAPRSAVDTVARAIAAGLGRVPDGTVVATAALQSDSEAPRGQALALQLSQQVAGRLGPAVKALDRPVALEEARKQAAAAPGVVYLQPKLAAGRLQLSADAYPFPRNVWSRARAVAPGPVAHTFTQAPFDAEVRSYLRPLRFDEPQVAKYEGADRGILALACGDLDGDGGTDLVTVTRKRVLQLRLRQGKVERVREARWSGLVAIAPSPLREPLAFATIVEAPFSAARQGYLDVGLSDRAVSVRLGPTFDKRAELPGMVVPSGRATACTPLSKLMLGQTLAACTPADAAPAVSKLKGPSDAIASGFIVTRQGTGSAPVAVRVKSALVMQGGEQDVVIGRVGAQLALADLDQDGAIEMISTRDILWRKHDVATVRTLLQSGTVKRRFELPVKTGVDALASCPPDGPGRAPFVIATGEQLWVVR